MIAHIDIDIQRSDINCLAGLNWLNDEVGTILSDHLFVTQICRDLLLVRNGKITPLQLSCFICAICRCVDQF